MMPNTNQNRGGISDDDMGEASGLMISSPEVAEVQSLAYELAKVHRRYVGRYSKDYNLQEAEASAEVQEDMRTVATVGEHDAIEQAGLIDVLPQETSWFDLEKIAESDPAAMMRYWRAINQAALDELQSGHSAAIGIAPTEGDTPWERAQFLALRASVIYEWKPRGGIELTLIDVIVQAQVCYQRWLRVLVAAVEQQAKYSRSIYNINPIPQPPRLSDAQAVEQAAAMVDRFNRLSLRTLRQLRDLRRYTSQVTIQSAGQVNIGEQQINRAGI